jgi:hypothetical protein
MSDHSISQLQVNTILIVVDLILTAVVAIVTTMRFRAKCGDVECACKPKEQARSPGSMTSPSDGEVPRNTVAIVMASPTHQEIEEEPSPPK